MLYIDASILTILHISLRTECREITSTAGKCKSRKQQMHRKNQQACAALEVIFKDGLL